MPEKSADEPQEAFETTDTHPPSQPNQDGINNGCSIRTESNILHNKKLFAFVIVLVIVLASVSYVLRDESTPINPHDPDFYNRYPTIPYDLFFLRIESSTLLWGNFTHDYVNNKGLLAVQITPTIQELANGFMDSYPDDIVLQAKAAFDFVTEEISLGEYEPENVLPYPDTTLTTKEGVCVGYASLLASLLYAEGLEVAYVYTVDEQHGGIPHIYVAVKLPGYTPPNGVQEKIKSYIGTDWIGLDATGGYSEFGQLNPDSDLHWNIRKIVGVPIYGAVFTFNFPSSFASYDKELGYYFDIECELYAFKHDMDNDVTFTFELRDNNVTIDREVINVICGQESLTRAEFILGYLDDFESDDYWNDVVIYLIITP